MTRSPPGLGTHLGQVTVFREKIKGPNCSLTFAKQKKTFSVPAPPAPTPPQRTKTPKRLKKCGQYEQKCIHLTKLATQLILNGHQLLSHISRTIGAHSIPALLAPFPPQVIIMESWVRKCSF